ncbi:ribonuclease III [Trametopsis cervina]|nr:ribonuclease III [Trametopsis cervina]
MKPFHSHRSSTIQSTINAAVFQSIHEGSHYIDPPKLSPELWDHVSIQNPENRAESERLEFLGDALVDACIAMELYKTIPDGNPHKYTEVRSVVHSNFTFANLVHKMGVRISADTKSLGDVFETMMGAYYTEKGFDALNVWVKHAFGPVIEAAAAAFDQHLAERNANSNAERSNPPSTPSNVGARRPSFSASTSRGKGKRRLSETARDTAPATATHEPTPLTPPPLNLPDSTYHMPSSSYTESLRRSPAPPHDVARPQGVTSSQLPGSSSESDSSSDSGESDSLPEFWEEVHLPDGEVVYLDHSTETTSWERPRRRRTSHRKFTLAEAEAVWTARLVAPLPPVPTSTDNNPSRTPSHRGQATDDPLRRPVHPAVITDLLQDGYILNEASTDSDFSQPGSVPEFWEVLHTDYGTIYYIDHPASSILHR